MAGITAFDIIGELKSLEEKGIIDSGVRKKWGAKVVNEGVTEEIIEQMASFKMREMEIRQEEQIRDAEKTRAVESFVAEPHTTESNTPETQTEPDPEPFPTNATVSDIITELRRLVETGVLHSKIGKKWESKAVKEGVTEEIIAQITAFRKRDMEVRKEADLITKSKTGLGSGLPSGNTNTEGTVSSISIIALVLGVMGLFFRTDDQIAEERRLQHAPHFATEIRKGRSVMPEPRLAGLEANTFRKLWKEQAQRVFEQSLSVEKVQPEARDKIDHVRAQHGSSPLDPEMVRQMVVIVQKVAQTPPGQAVPSQRVPVVQVRAEEAHAFPFSGLLMREAKCSARPSVVQDDPAGCPGEAAPCHPQFDGTEGGILLVERFEPCRSLGVTASQLFHREREVPGVAAEEFISSLTAEDGFHSIARHRANQAELRKGSAGDVDRDFENPEKLLQLVELRGAVRLKQYWIDAQRFRGLQSALPVGCARRSVDEAAGSSPLCPCSG